MYYNWYVAEQLAAMKESEIRRRIRDRWMFRQEKAARPVPAPAVTHPPAAAPQTCTRTCTCS